MLTGVIVSDAGGSYHVYFVFNSLICWIAQHIKHIESFKCSINDNCSFAHFNNTIPHTIGTFQLIKQGSLSSGMKLVYHMRNRSRYMGQSSHLLVLMLVQKLQLGRLNLPLNCRRFRIKSDCSCQKPIYMSNPIQSYPI
jgi:hypothetical protein